MLQALENSIRLNGNVLFLPLPYHCPKLFKQKIEAGKCVCVLNNRSSDCQPGSFRAIALSKEVHIYSGVLSLSIFFGSMLYSFWRARLTQRPLEHLIFYVSPISWVAIKFNQYVTKKFAQWPDQNTICYIQITSIASMSSRSACPSGQTV